MNSRPKSRRALALAGPPPDKALASMYQMLDQQSSTSNRALLSRFIRTRLRSFMATMSDAPVVAKLANGLQVQIDPSDVFGSEFFLGHCNEKRIIDAITSTFPANGAAVDVGANFGLYALHCAHVGGSVMAFEPAPSALALLKANVRRNKLQERIDVASEAIAENEGESSFFVASDASFSGLRDTGRSPLAQVLTVPHTTLDRALENYADDAIDLLKIDTEGHEWRVLRGARNTILRNCNLVILLEYSVKNLDEEGRLRINEEMAWLSEQGFSIWPLGKNDRPAPALDIGNADLGGGFSGSLVAFRHGVTFGETMLETLANSPIANEGPSAPEAVAVILEQYNALMTRLAEAEALARDESQGRHKSDKRYGEAEKRLDAARSSTTSLKERLQAMQIELEAENSRRSQREQLISDLRDQLERRSVDAESNVAIIRKQNDQILALRNSVEEVAGKESAASRAVVASNEQIAALRSYNNALSASLEKILGRLAELDSSGDEIDLVRGSLSGATNDDIANFTKRGLSRLSKLIKSAAQHSEQRSIATQTVAELRQRLQAAMESEAEQQIKWRQLDQTRVAKEEQLRATMDRLHEKASQKQVQIDELVARMDALQADHAQREQDWRQSVEKLNEKASQKQVHIVDLTERLRTLDESFCQARVHMAELNAEQRRAEASHAAQLEAMATKQRDEAAAFEAVKEELMAQVSDQASTIAKMAATIDFLHEQRREADRAVHRMFAKLDEKARLRQHEILRLTETLTNERRQHAVKRPESSMDMVTDRDSG